MKNRISKFPGNKWIQGLFAIFIAVLTFFIITLPISFRPTPALLEIGDVAFQDITAPRPLSFTSQNLTEQAMDEAEKLVSPVYLPADPEISQKQVESLNSYLSYVSSIRNDEFSSQEEKITDILSSEMAEVDEEITSQMLSLTDERWALIKEESLFLLEETMRSTIREDQLVNVQRNIYPQINFDFNDVETGLINTIVTQFIVPNSLFSNEKTNEAILNARETVDPVIKSYAAGERIVSSGEIITPQKFEALEELGYTNNRNRTFDFISAGLLVTIMLGTSILYIRRMRRSRGATISGMPIIAVLFLIFLLSARLIIPNHTILPYIFPAAAFGLTLSSVFGFETGLIGVLVLSVLAAYDQPNSIDLAFYYFLPSAISIFILGRGRRINIFFIAGLALALSGSGIALSYRMLNAFLDIAGAGTLIGASFANGVLSISLSLVFQFLISQMLGKTTALQLMDLSRPDHPLLQKLLINAPGTYQHSLQVANLAEQAAREINADPLLTRVGVLYHDVGKSENPGFFIENQALSQVNTHEDMDPVLSAATIIQHVPNGEKLAKKYRLPIPIQAFILEHHGTLLTRYQYNQAVIDAGGEEKVEKSLFQYPGPIPQSRETALLMLADGCEARMRSENPSSADEIREIVKNSIDYYLKKGQLDNSDLTLTDIQKIIQSFSRTIKNTFHHRIKYPDEK